LSQDIVTFYKINTQQYHSTEAYKTVTESLITISSL